jgi:hypothetical protein
MHAPESQSPPASADGLSVTGSPARSDVMQAVDQTAGRAEETDHLPGHLSQIDTGHLPVMQGQIGRTTCYAKKPDYTEHFVASLSKVLKSLKSSATLW